MNITELDSYNLEDAVKFNDHLNPRLWDDREHLRPEVREHLLEIANDFREFLGVTDLAIQDITISGSNAAYTYTPNSDIDLHLVVDMPDDPVYRELFDAKKFQYNEQHDIKIGGADVELYVQDADQPHISQGIYSLVNNNWLQVPRRVKSVVDDTSTQDKFEKVGRQIERAIKSGNLKRMTRLAEKIKRMRQTGLEAHGEFGPENLAFKLLRSQGLIKQLYDARNAAKDQEFSLAEKTVKPRVTYGFQTPVVVEADPMGLEEESTPTDEEILQDFIHFCVAELKIQQMPTIKLRRDPQWPVVHATFGRYINDKHLLEVAWGSRHIMDVLRTVAHELTHKHQHERDGQRMGATAGETGSPWENEANARAGILMRDYARMHPEYFAVGQAEDLKETEVDEDLKGSAVAALSACIIGGGTLGGCATQQGLRPMDAARIIYNAKQYNSSVIRADVAQELNNFIRAQGGDPNAQNQSRLYQLQRQPQNESASGYIPTKRQAKDPRYSMALTVDIKPGQVGREANKLKLKTDSQGHPQVANPNGLFEKLMLELKQFNEKKLFALAEEELDEVRMASSNLQQWARSPEAEGIRAGFEAELIFRDTNSGDDDDYEMEPDYDADERCRSIQQVIDFFQGGDYGGLNARQEARLVDDLDESYMNWYDEEMRKAFRDEAEDLIRKVIVDEGDWDLDNEIQKQLDLLGLSNDEINAIVNAGERAPKFTSTKEQQAYAEANPLYQKYLDAQEEAEGLLDDLIADEVRKQGPNWDAALDDFRDNFTLDDDSGFFDDVGLRWMSDVANNYDLDWPYMTGGGGNDGSRSWEEIGDSLNGAIDMPVKVSSNYHSTTRREGVWIVEPDSSLEPDDREDFGLEIVSPPMPLEQALEKLQEVTDWANGDGNAYTNSSTGLHMGVSVPFKGGDVDYLKLILFLGDEYVLQQFGREANTYCKSAMSKFRENIKGGRSDPMSVIKLMQHGLLELAHKEIQKGVGEGKYTSAHIQKGYIEFRSAGGDWLAEANAMLGEAAGIGSTNKLQNTMLRYARAMSLAANPAEERREYAKKLYKLVAPEGDSELALFSQYAAGELTAEQLKKRWAEKTIGKELKTNQRWKLFHTDGTPVTGQEYNGYTEDEAWEKAWKKLAPGATLNGFKQSYELRNMSEEQQWEVYDVNTGATLEIVKGKNRGEVADQVYDKYVDQSIGFNVRPYVDPATMTPRAKLAKRIAEPRQKGDWDVIYKPTGRVIDTILRVDREQAEKLLKQVAVLHDFKNADNLEIRPQQAVKDITPDVAQNFAPQDATEVPRNWEYVDRITGRVVDTVSNASYNQANQVQADVERRYPAADIYLRSVGPSPELEETLVALKSGPWTIMEDAGGPVEVRKSRMFDQTVADRARQLPNLADRIQEFLAFKMANPGQPWGKDTQFVSAGPLARALPKLRHVHLTRDLSLFYTIGGRDPAVIRLYGVFSHADSGTGTPGNINRQRSLARQLDNQFESVVNRPAQVTRIDDHPIEDFAANMQTYYHTDDWSESGQFPKGANIPKRFTGQSQGVYAGDPTFTALYATGSSKETRYVAKYGPGQPVVWFDKKDLSRIRGKQTYLTVFNADNFKRVPSGEYFSSNPGEPVKQEKITDPFQYITDQGWVIRVTDNLPAVLKKLQKEKDAQYGSEGMGVQENFADGRGPGRPGDSQRHGIPKGATMAELEKASHSKGRKGQLARWQLNMRRGHKK